MSTTRAGRAVKRAALVIIALLVFGMPLAISIWGG